ncbi:Sodium:proline symporter [Cupriavidus sp. H18C1]|jgi:hypothetical protein|uniref:sodium/proton-translocating pyrophosphatase n=1 Tax=Cupriavidus TaxID=106589 RepID=UPI0011ECAC19|nr:MULTISPECIES: sodium/proton-translocating pyrophosphatase [Cupriavidus]KAA0180287.1 sodium/proton-translocating pyrophosphatase [Cupriavidus gilardii]MCA7083562.1 hypothetical protein [Cupriavidus sp. DB3]UZN50857.1 hypothetical protein KZ686_20840 [Cupriavidus cauae]
MELHMHSHHYVRRVPDWSAAAVSGLAAGALLLVLELFWSTMIAGTNPWPTTRMIAAIVMGPDVLQSGMFSVATVTAALVIHFVLGAVLGMILAAIMAPFQLDSSLGMALLVGAVFGLVIYVINFYGMTRFFPWFADARGWHTLFGNIVFGMCAAAAYWKLESKDVTH